MTFSNHVFETVYRRLQVGAILGSIANRNRNYRPKDIEYNADTQRGSNCRSTSSEQRITVNNTILDNVTQHYGETKSVTYDMESGFMLMDFKPARRNLNPRSTGFKLRNFEHFDGLNSPTPRSQNHWQGDMSYTVYGSDADNRIDVRGKANAVWGKDGNDIIKGSGNSFIYGGDGRDIIQASRRSVLYGGDGVDTFLVALPFFKDNGRGGLMGKSGGLTRIKDFDLNNDRLHLNRRINDNDEFVQVWPAGGYTAAYKNRQTIISQHGEPIVALDNIHPDFIRIRNDGFVTGV